MRENETGIVKEAFKALLEGCCCLKSFLWIDGEGLLENDLQTVGHIGIDSAGGLHLVVQNRLLGGFSGWPKEGVAPAEHLVEDDAESKDVRSVVYRRLFELLGAHVGHAFVAWSTDTLVGSRKPKVGDLYLPLEACENVGRKKTSVNEVEGYWAASSQYLALMGVLQAFQGLQHHEERVREWERDVFGPATLEHSSQVLAVHVLHRDVVGLVDLAQVENLNDVGV